MSENDASNSDIERHRSGRGLTRRQVLAGLGGAGALVTLYRVGDAAPLLTAKDDKDDDHDDHGGHDGDDDDNVIVTGTVPAGSTTVKIVDDDPDGFSPSVVTIEAGRSVTFVNTHDDAHTATGIGFDTGIMQPGTMATIVFDTPGTFPYACQIHPEMTGTVEVRGTPGQATPDAASPVASPATATGTMFSVDILNFAFVAAEIRVPAGSMVSWTNRDQVPHTATNADGAFNTGTIDPGQTADVILNDVGSFAYQCAFHPNMKGRITVE